MWNQNWSRSTALQSPQCNEHKCSRQIPQRQGCFNHLLAITLEDLMYKAGRLLLQATVGSLLLYRQAISSSSTAHLHSVAPNQRLKSHLHCHSIFTAQVRMDTISPIGIHSATASWLTTTKTVNANIHPKVKHHTYNWSSNTMSNHDKQRPMWN